MHRLSIAVIFFRCISRKHDSIGIDASDNKLLSKDLLLPPPAEAPRGPPLLAIVKKSPGVLGLQLLLAGFRPYISIIECLLPTKLA